MLQLIDPVTGGPYFATGSKGTLTLSPQENGGVVTPSDATIHDPPIAVWVGDAGPVNVNVVPYGREGDKTVTFPLMAGMTVPVLCKQVLATGTTAVSLFLGSAWPTFVPGSGGSSGPITADTTTVTADTTSFTADNG